MGSGVPRATSQIQPVAHSLGTQRSGGVTMVADMVVLAQNVRAPSAADAAVAGDALVEAGVEEVLLFGSVARGEADEYSDIDVVAVFADIDYAQRSEMGRQLEEVARAAVGRWPVQVYITDRPEWQNRVEKVSGSFERAICREAVRVAAARTRGRVRWDKEMVLPMSNPDEALRQFVDRVLAQIASLRRAAIPSPDEFDVGVPASGREVERLLRMVQVCTHSAMAVELALKALAVLRHVPTPSDEALKHAGHSISECLQLLPGSVRGSVEELVTRRGVSTDDLSGWRIESTYPEDVDALYQKADERADAYVGTALDVCGFVFDDLREVVGDTPGLLSASDRWQRYSAYLGERDIRTGRLVATPAATAGVDLDL